MPVTKGEPMSLHQRLKSRIAFVLASTMTALLGLAGCAERPNDPAAERKFVFVTNSDSAFWDAAEKGWTEAGEKAGIEPQFLRNKQGDANGQIRILEQIASRTDVAGLAISVVDASAVGIIEKLRAIGQKIPVVTVDSDCKPEDRTARRAYIGTNNEQAGKTAGRIAKLLLPKGGNWIGFVGTEDADNARARIQGFANEAGESFKRLDVFQDQTDQGKARENVRVALNKDVQLLFGIYSYNAPAIAEVVADAQQRDKVKILTFDAEENTLRAILAGQIDATVVQNTFDMGAQAVVLLKAFMDDDKTKLQEMLGSGTELDTKVRVIVPDDSTIDDPNLQKVSDFKEYMNKMGLRST
jgi:ribose transport system substrate-binding protein